MLIGETPIGEPPGIGDSFVVRSCAYDMDLWVIFTGSEPLEGGEIRYYLNRQYNTILKNRQPYHTPTKWASVTLIRLHTNSM